jgi:DNA-binding CsgD family transcriptional regulator
VAASRRSRACSAGARWVLYLTPVSRRTGYSSDILQALYDLSPAEARIASLILAGKTVAAIAADAGNSEHTVRTQLKSIFAKTGVSSQAELTRLLVDPMCVAPRR